MTGWGERICRVLVTAVVLAPVSPLHAQRARENAVAEASDAFGTTVGREEIGLYSATSARGFSPTQAGNLRIGGLYFDQVAKPATRIVRGSSVHVGISAQGLLFPAPTGVVDFKLRSPDEPEPAAGALVGVASYGQSYGEFDFQLPVVAETLSIGGGVGYSRNSSHRIADRTDEWTAGVVGRWQPTPSLTITPFWGMTEHREYGEKQHVFIGNSGYPRYRGVDLMPQPWADYGMTSVNFGSTLNLTAADGWRVDAGVFHSETRSPLNYDPFLFNVNGAGEGEYSITAAPPRTTESTSGELRFSRSFVAGNLHSTLHASVRGRDRSGRSGGADTVYFGPATTRRVPQVPEPVFSPGPTTLIEARQVTPGLAYDGVWRNLGSFSLGVQRTSYERKVTTPGGNPVVGSSSQWLYNMAAAAFLSPRLVAYAGYTRGFEEIGNAPLNATNRDEAVPAQLTEQVDAGVKFDVTRELQLVVGVFQIEKPYFDLDPVNTYRRVGVTRNRGAEVSLAGELIEGLTVVAGVTLIDPEVMSEIAADGRQSRVAVGPVPGLARINFQYTVASVAGLALEAKIERTSPRYARFDTVRLPAVATVDMGIRYGTRILGRNSTFRLQGFNLTNEYGLTPAASGQLTPFDSRRFDVSLAVDF